MTFTQITLAYLVLLTPFFIAGISVLVKRCERNLSPQEPNKIITLALLAALFWPVTLGWLFYRAGLAMRQWLATLWVRRIGGRAA